MTGEQAQAGLRQMTAEDLDQVIELEDELFGSDSWTREMLVSELEQQPATRHYLVADDAGRIAGYAGLLASGQQGDVLTIGVASDWQGHGIGTALLRALLSEAGRRGCREVFLEVRTDNHRAQDLYRRHEFTEIGIRRGYYQPSGADALVMRRDLTLTERTPAKPAAAKAAPANVAPANVAPANVVPANVAPANVAPAKSAAGEPARAKPEPAERGMR